MKSKSQAFKDLLSAEASEEPKVPEVSSETPEVIVEAMEQTMSALAPSVIERQILENALQGISVAQTSYTIGIPESSVRGYLRKPAVKEYMKEVKEAMNEIDQMMITGTLRGILSSRIQDNAEDGGKLSDLSKKDTLDVIKTFADITNGIAKGAKEEKADNVFTNIYQQILTKD